MAITKNDIFRGIGLALSLTREARASRNETRANRRLEISEEKHAISVQKSKAKKHFGRTVS